MAKNRTPRRVDTMVYETEKDDYNIIDFFNKFRNRLPQTVMITVGFYGDLDGHSFSKGQVVRLLTDSKQQRVVGRAVYKGSQRLFSIPTSYHVEMTVVSKNGKGKTGNCIYHLVDACQLPITIQMAKQHKKAGKIHVDGSATITTDDLYEVELIEEYDHLSLLGNFMVDGEAYDDIVDIPLYLSHMRVIIVTGVKGKTREEWLAQLEEVDHSCECLEYDLEFGNAGIEIYKHDRLPSEERRIKPTMSASNTHLSDTPEMDSSTHSNYDEYDTGNYEIMEPPQIHINTASISPSELSSTQQDDFDAGIYEEVIEDHPKPPIPTPTFKSELSAALQLKKHVPNAQPPPIAPKPPQIGPKPGKSQQKSKRASPNTKTPPVQMQPKGDTNKVKVNKPEEQRPIKTPPMANIYSNMLPTGQVAPAVRQSNTVSHQEEPLSKTESHNSTTENQTFPEKRTALSGPDVDKLSIDELGEYLKQLRLEKYVVVFKDQMVDGNMLVELDKDILKEEFGFSTLEALRLMKFAKDGHIPN